MTHYSPGLVVIENSISRHVLIFDEIMMDYKKIQSFGFVSTKQKWRLKHHLPPDHIFISALREISRTQSLLIILRRLKKCSYILTQ